MGDDFIRNREGRIIGSTRDAANGGWIRDGVGNLVARIDADGKTRDREGRIVGPGDQRLRELGRRNKD
jgi:YD repeat-containing protein